MEPVVGTEAAKMPSGHPAFCASDLISQVHGILSTAHNRGTGTRPPGVHEATHATTDMPLRELSRVTPDQLRRCQGLLVSARSRVRLDAVESHEMRVAVPNTCPSFAHRRSSSSSRLWHVLVFVRHGGFLDPALGFVLLPRNALGVDTQQDVDAVACPLGDLRGGYSSIQPGGNGCVP